MKSMGIHFQMVSPSFVSQSDLVLRLAWWWSGYDNGAGRGMSECIRRYWVRLALDVSKSGSRVLVTKRFGKLVVSADNQMYPHLPRF